MFPNHNIPSKVITLLIRDSDMETIQNTQRISISNRSHTTRKRTLKINKITKNGKRTILKFFNAVKNPYKPLYRLV